MTARLLLMQEFRSQNPDPEMSVEDFVELVLACLGTVGGWLLG